MDNRGTGKEQPATVTCATAAGFFMAKVPRFTYPDWEGEPTWKPRNVTVFRVTEGDMTIMQLWLTIELECKNEETAIVAFDRKVHYDFFVLLQMLHLKGWGMDHVQGD